MYNSSTPIQGYIHLASAIINSAVVQNDKQFFESKWGQYLIDTVSVYTNKLDMLLGTHSTYTEDDSN